MIGFSRHSRPSASLRVNSGGNLAGIPAALSRRRFIAAVGGGAAAGWVAGFAGRLAAQVPVESPSPNQITGAPVVAPETPGATMAGDGYIPVRRPPKPNARPSMDAEARDALERQISCPCPCTLDVFTCRTSMPCGFSPRMHQDVVRLIDGGYTDDEIMAAFTSAYGEHIRMAPKREGFNLVGYLTPAAAVVTAGTVVAVLIRRWGARAAAVAARPGAAREVIATPDELARLDAAVRGDGA